MSIAYCSKNSTHLFAKIIINNTLKIYVVLEKNMIIFLITSEIYSPTLIGSK